MRRTLPSILVTAGPTREYIDPTRFISNPSSGKMGYLIAETAKKMGCKVLLISGPTDIKSIPVKTIYVTTARDMFAVFRRYYDHYDIVIMAAAVSDYRPMKIYPKKIKKRNRIKSLDLVPNPDILSWASQKKKSHLLIGFAAETDHVISNARKKLIKKKLDMIVANRVGQTSAGFESEDIEFSIIENGYLSKPLTLWKKKKLAVEIVRRAIMRKANDN